MWKKISGWKENEDVGFEGTLDRMAKMNGVRRYGHVIRRDDDNI